MTDIVFGSLPQGQFTVLAVDPETGVLLDQKSLTKARNGLNRKAIAASKEDAITLGKSLLLRNPGIQVLILDSNGEQLISLPEAR